MRMDDATAFGVFQAVRFAANDGSPFCPACGCVKVYTLAETPMRWKCSACRKKFSVTSNTIFHSRKLAIRDYLAVIALFCNGVKGTSALQMSRDMNINPKSAFVLLHKLREAIGAEIEASGELSGETEIDGAYVGKGPKPANKKADRADRRSADTKRQVVVVARERGGNARTWIVDREADAIPMIRKHVASGTTVHADESAAWDILHASFSMKRVNHSVEYMADDGACTNQAESFFSRLRRAEMGIHHHIGGRQLRAFNNQKGWRGEHPRPPQGGHPDPKNA